MKPHTDDLVQDKYPQYASNGDTPVSRKAIDITIIGIIDANDVRTTTPLIQQCRSLKLVAEVTVSSSKTRLISTTG